MKRIDVLPDDVLIGIFDFYVNPSCGVKAEIEKWQSLVHVCRRWRSLIFRSPRRLDLRLCCTPETPARDTLDVWPPLPLIVRGTNMSLLSYVDNIIAVLGQSNRVCEVSLYDLADWQLEKVLAAMQVPFPELTEFRLSSHDETPPVIPNSFLGGSAPRLEYFQLWGITFTGLPKLFLSTTQLAQLWLSDLPHSGYISPEGMVALLCSLSSLELLGLDFGDPQSHPDLESQSLPPSERSILPALDDFIFKGDIEYLEVLVTFIDTPQLNSLEINFFDPDQIGFDTPRLAQFINRTPTLRACDNAHVKFDNWITSVYFDARSGALEIGISFGEPDLQLSSIAQLCNSFSPLPSTVKDLYIELDDKDSPLVWTSDAIENTLLVQFLLPFTAVKNLYLSKESALGIAAGLQELVGSRITEVLPCLQNIFVDGLDVEPSGPLQENIWQFAGARRRSGHPIAIIPYWD